MWIVASRAEPRHRIAFGTRETADKFVETARNSSAWTEPSEVDILEPAPTTDANTST